MVYSDIRLEVLPGYRLKLTFSGGSEAVINMRNRVGGIRFGRLADESLFATAEISGDEIVWDDGKICIRAYIYEILESPLMERS